MKIQKGIRSFVIASVLALLVLSVFATFVAAQRDRLGLREQFREQLRERLEVTKTQISDIKEKIKECKGPEANVTACQQVRAEALELAKTRFGLAINSTIERLEEVKERVLANENMSEEAKQRVANAIDAQIARLQQLSAVKAVDAKAMLETIKKYKEEREKARIEIGKAIEERRLERIGLITEKAERIEAKLERFLEKRNATGEFSEEIAALKAELEAAKQAKESAMAIWQDLKARKESITANETRESIRLIHSYIEQAKAHLKEANKILKSIIAELKEKKRIEKSAEIKGKSGGAAEETGETSGETGGEIGAASKAVEAGSEGQSEQTEQTGQTEAAQEENQ
jgi:phage shock protein A